MNRIALIYLRLLLQEHAWPRTAVFADGYGGWLDNRFDRSPS